MNETAVEEEMLLIVFLYYKKLEKKDNKVNNLSYQDQEKQTLKTNMQPLGMIQPKLSL